MTAIKTATKQLKECRKEIAQLRSKKDSRSKEEKIAVLGNIMKRATDIVKDLNGTVKNLENKVK